MGFLEMRNKLMENFSEITKDATHLFEVDVDKDEMWNLYLDSFSEGTNKIYRERREHDCSCCRHFVKTIGNVVVIKENQVSTIWDFRMNDSVYQPVLDALDSYVKAHMVSDVFVSKEKQIGTKENYELLDDGQIQKWDHFYLEFPEKFVNKTSYSKGKIQGMYRDTKNVFGRSLEEISLEAVDVIWELIVSNTLYKGEEWKTMLMEFRRYKVGYDELAEAKEKELYLWEKSVEAGKSIGRIRNHAIGTLLVNVSEGMDLDLAVRKYEQIVAPCNYKRPKEIYTKKMLEEAKQKIEELGYMDSLGRRFATLDDIRVNNILFSNKDSAKKISGLDDIFAAMKSKAISKPKKFSKVGEIDIQKFISDVLPTAREVEVYFENKHKHNLVSLIAPENKEAKSMFKWDNNFSWAYTGNMTDSMKERVKKAGGNVDGVLRFSIQWNEGANDNSDLDAHCIEPTGNEIYFRNCRKPDFSSLGGQLDVDIIHPGSNIAVENITWLKKDKMKTGVYQFFVHQYCARGSKGFSAEIEFDGQIYSFEYNKPLRTGEKVPVAKVILHGDGRFEIKEFLPSNVSSKEVWGVKTNQFVPVSVVMHSPNYWDEQEGLGHKHYFFMMKGCVNDETPNGFYNEFLKNELMEHKRVLAALGSKMQVKETEDQLSGLGFSATKREELVVKVKGNTERIMKVKF